jgi:UDP-glucuronate decarboxylase
MHILVTGGAGFIGSHLCERLIERRHDVVCLDNYFTGSKDNIRHLMGHHHFEVVRHDIIHYIDIEIDQIYNLACPASPVHYQHDAVRTIHANVLGVTNILELARRTGARILQASTSEVYGDPLVHPQTEDYWGNVNPIGPRSCYDEGKRVAESLMMDYHRQHGVDIRIARIFNTYGPRMATDDGRVVSTFIVQALNGEPLTVFGKGDQTRSFCHVRDLLDGLIALMNTPEVTEPVNLGNPDEFTILQLAELVRDRTGSKSEIRFSDLPVDDPVRRRPDITRARKLLGWEPRIPIDDGLRSTIEYFEGVLRARGRLGTSSRLARAIKSLEREIPDGTANDG